jgi:hypothetical protein
MAISDAKVRMHRDLRVDVTKGGTFVLSFGDFRPFPPFAAPARMGT